MKWVEQIETDSLDEAVALSVKKWQFFSSCTRDKLDEYCHEIRHNCGLCLYFKDDALSQSQRCKLCPLSKRGFSGIYERGQDTGRYDCPSEISECSRLAFNGHSMEAFRKVARSIRDRLRTF